MCLGPPSGLKPPWTKTRGRTHNHGQTSTVILLNSCAFISQSIVFVLYSDIVSTLAADGGIASLSASSFGGFVCVCFNALFTSKNTLSPTWRCMAGAVIWYAQFLGCSFYLYMHTNWSNGEWCMRRSCALRIHHTVCQMGFWDQLLYLPDSDPEHYQVIWINTWFCQPCWCRCWMAIKWREH